MSQELSIGGLVEKSQYLKKFQKLASVAPEAFQLSGDLCVIEVLGQLEKSVTFANGTKLIMADSKSHKQGHNEKTMEFGLVLMTGPGDVYEDGSRAEMNVKVGDVILLPNNVTLFSQFGSLGKYEPYTIGILRAAAVLVNMPDPVKAFEVLNSEEA
jgi:co-chaperonin GroES (HSP10)